MDEFSEKTGCFMAGIGIVLGLIISIGPLLIGASLTVGLLGSCQDARLVMIAESLLALMSAAVIFLTYFGIGPFQKSGQLLRTALATAAVIDTIYFGAMAFSLPGYCGIHSLF